MTATVHHLPCITPRRAARYVQLLDTCTDPRDQRLRQEYLVKEAEGLGAEIVRLDAETGTISCRVLHGVVPVSDAHPPVTSTAKPLGNAFTAFCVVTVLMLTGLFGWAALTDSKARAAAEAETRRAM